MDTQLLNRSFRKILIVILLVFPILGCATIPKGPLKSDEVRLTDLTIIETGDKGKGVKFYKAIIKYQHGEKISSEDIVLSCTTLTWYWQT